ncbi:hypothetical protein [Caulobacter endophyticus]|uniref:hypothetical protein n=1 Tax=Caulobacter endophyticus TaxID=2172652 RepID=UPI00240EC42B|nr:hypothetical protein [Caulobacter endophyticus]MDG2528923.1 hypothetical protein [Caulobacter endophyticus]
MTKTFAFATAAAVAAVIGVAGPASAQLAPRPTVIKGDVTQTAKVGAMVSVAIGQGAKSVVAQSSVYEDSTIGGKVTQTSKADTIVSVAIGQNAYASAVQSSVGVPKP